MPTYITTKSTKKSLSLLALEMQCYGQSGRVQMSPLMRNSGMALTMLPSCMFMADRLCTSAQSYLPGYAASSRRRLCSAPRERRLSPTWCCAQMAACFFAVRYGFPTCNHNPVCSLHRRADCKYSVAASAVPFKPLIRINQGGAPTARYNARHTVLGAINLVHTHRGGVQRPNVLLR